MGFVITGLLFYILQITTSWLKIPMVEKLIIKVCQPLWVIRQFFTDGTPPHTAILPGVRPIYVASYGCLSIQNKSAHQSLVILHQLHQAAVISHQAWIKSPAIPYQSPVTGHPVTGHPGSG